MTGAPPVAAGAAAQVLHASCVALDARRGLLAIGPSGAGKSALCLQLMALGALLVADDGCALSVVPGGVEGAAALVARCPAAIRGRIEARGLGILRAETLPEARIALVVDLGRRETDRLPPQRNITLSGVVIPLVHACESAHFPAALLQYLKVGRDA